MTPTELIAVTKNEPMEFSPGEKYQYNNSAYILLGYIIENISGMSYEDYIQKNILTPLGMRNSFYGSKSKLIPNRASGYQTFGNDYRNADYLSMTLPYAAGSLMSTVDDLLLWNQAIHNNTLISEKSKQLAFSNYKRNDGKPIYYGYGWAVNKIEGSPTLEHGGGIFGYTTYGLYAPKENLYVIVLTNTTAKSPDNLALRTMAAAMNKKLSREEVTLTEKQHQQWTGAYQFDDVARFITFENGTLYSQRDGGEKLKLIPLGQNNYQFEDTYTTYNFSNENGKRTAEMANRIIKSKGIETNIQPSEEKEGISLAPELLSSYVGTYELAAGFEIVVTKENNSIFGQATGQSKFELFAESPDNFFLKAVPAKVVFNKNSTGKIESLTLFQGGQEIKGKKTK